MIDLSAEKIVVVGGGSGIGASVTAMARDRGAHVVTVGRRDPADVHADISSPGECDRAIERSCQELGGIDHLVIAAGASRYASIADTDFDLWQHLLLTNLVAAGLLTRAALPHLMDGAHASVVTVSSAAGIRAHPYFTAYAASKAGLIHWTRVAALELAPHIRVNCVSPGPIDTPMITEVVPEGHTPDSWKVELGKHTALLRVGTADEVAAAICFLVSSEATYITGAVVPVDGGEVA